jgi:hypothetical protein
MGKRRFWVCKNLEGISVAGHFLVCENEDAVSYYFYNTGRRLDEKNWSVARGMGPNITYNASRHKETLKLPLS